MSEKEYNDICKEFKKGKIRCGIKEKWAEHYGEPWPTYQQEYFEKHGITNNDKLGKIMICIILSLRNMADQMSGGI